jgi:hypothetical protein
MPGRRGYRPDRDFLLFIRRRPATRREAPRHDRHSTATIMKDKASLLFLSAITYAGLAACLVPLSPRAADDPGSAVAMTRSPASDAPAVPVGDAAHRRPDHQRSDHPSEIGLPKIS